MNMNLQVNLQVGSKIKIITNESYSFTTIEKVETIYTIVKNDKQHNYDLVDENNVSFAGIFYSINDIIPLLNELLISDSEWFLLYEVLENKENNKMNKYIKLILEQKLKENNINNDEWFEIKGWKNNYMYNGECLLNSYKNPISFKNHYRLMGLVENNFIKILSPDKDIMLFLKLIKSEYKWIAKDKDNSIGLYISKPYKKTEWWTNNTEYINITSIFNLDFDFLSWEDSEPTLISDILLKFKEEL